MAEALTLSDDSTPVSSGTGATAIRIIAIGAVYFVLARVGQTLAIDPGNVTPIWPASGFALAVAMQRRAGWWVGIWLGNFLGNTWAFLDTSTASDLLRTTLTGLAIGPGDVLQAWGGAELYRRWTDNRCGFDSVHDVFMFVASQSIACLASATPGVMSLCTGQIIPFADYGYTWLTWYLGDGIGIITVAPVLLLWLQRVRSAKKGRFSAEAAAMIGAGLGSALLVFTDVTELSLFAVPTAVLLWAAVRGNQLNVAIVGVVVSAGAIYGTSSGTGPFRSQDLNLALMSLQLYMATTVISGLAVAAALEERSRTTKRLDASENMRRQSESELEIAAHVQKELLPSRPPQVDGFEFAARCVPAVVAAADFFDFMELKDGQVAIVVGDVAGHGVGPALITASVRSHIRSLRQYHSSPGELLTAANQGLCEDELATRFATACLAALDRRTRRLSWSAAGHTALVVDPDGSLSELEPTGLPLGVKDAEVYPDGPSFVLESGSMLVMLTDGFAEARNEDRELFGRDRLHESLLRLRDRSADEIVSRLIDDVSSFCSPEVPEDDLTLVVVKAV